MDLVIYKFFVDVYYCKFHFYKSQFYSKITNLVLNSFWTFQKFLAHCAHFCAQFSISARYQYKLLYLPILITDTYRDFPYLQNRLSGKIAILAPIRYVSFIGSYTGVGCAWECLGMHRCVRVCAGVCGCVRVCTGVCGCAWVCMDVCGYARVWTGVCASVCGCNWLCMGVCRCVWNEFSVYLLETWVLTSADFNTYPIRIFSKEMNSILNTFILFSGCILLGKLKSFDFSKKNWVVIVIFCKLLKYFLRFISVYISHGCGQ